jgi:DNA repair protein RecO (recombination protein O)
VDLASGIRLESAVIVDRWIGSLACLVVCLSSFVCMSRTYKATGINLKSQPLGESDRLLTILTREFGLVRAIAMGARKHNSKLGGRSGLFVVNDLLIAKGRSLDKITQADTLESYPGLGLDLKKLTASQYLAELCLCQALSEQPQDELFLLLNEHLQRLERSPAPLVMAHLTHAIFQMLVLAGVAPQVYACCMTRQAIAPNFGHSDWRTGFSIPAGGTVTLEVLERLNAQNQHPRPPVASKPSAATQNVRITAAELFLLQQLAQPQLPDLAVLPATAPAAPVALPSAALWCAVERLLRQYSQFHFDRQIRSATLIEACFLPTPFPSPEV